MPPFWNAIAKQPRARRPHRVVAERAEVRELAHRHRRHPVFAGPFDGQVDRDHAGNLAEAEPAVEADGGSPVVERRDRGDRPEMTTAHPPVVEGHEMRSVGVDAAQVGFDQVVGNRHRLVGGHAERAEQALELGPEDRLPDDGGRGSVGVHGGPSPSSRPSNRMALPRTIWCTVGASRSPNSSFATWCVFGQVPSWCG